MAPTTVVAFSVRAWEGGRGEGIFYYRGRSHCNRNPHPEPLHTPSWVLPGELPPFWQGRGRRNPTHSPREWKTPEGKTQYITNSGGAGTRARTQEPPTHSLTR